MKFKEFRMLCINLIILILMLLGMLFFFMDKQFSRAIMGSVIILIMATMILSKYTLKVFDDSLLGYHFKGIGIIPVLIEFKDIKEVTVLSKHRLRIVHKENATMYIVSANAFYQELQQKMDKYQKDNA